MINFNASVVIINHGKINIYEYRLNLNFSSFQKGMFKDWFFISTQ